MTGFATSVISCGVEAGIEADLGPDQTPDGRPGVSVLLFGMSSKDLAKQLERRAGQCVLTCPSTALFAGMNGKERLPLGKNLRYFGDGHQISKQIDGRRYWRVPVIDGEFLVEEGTGRGAAVGGGNFLVLARRRTEKALVGCEDAVAAMRNVLNVVLPFPGGIVRSGSKVGSKYKALMASTNGLRSDAARPGALAVERGDRRGAGDRSQWTDRGRRRQGNARWDRGGLRARCGRRHRAHLRRNYGRKVGQHHFRLHEVMA
jgi:formylmethanofuran--tetrahydromethanopterin N-formyltransferase